MVKVRLTRGALTADVPETETSVGALRRFAAGAFRLPRNAPVYLTFVDEENDVVTLGDADAELESAFESVVRRGMDTLVVNVVSVDVAESDDGFEIVNFESHAPSVASTSGGDGDVSSVRTPVPLDAATRTVTGNSTLPPDPPPQPATTTTTTSATQTVSKPDLSNASYAEIDETDDEDADAPAPPPPFEVGGEPPAVAPEVIVSETLPEPPAAAGAAKQEEQDKNKDKDAVVESATLSAIDMVATATEAPASPTQRQDKADLRRRTAEVLRVRANVEALVEALRSDAVVSAVVDAATAEGDGSASAHDVLKSRHVAPLLEVVSRAVRDAPALGPLLVDTMAHVALSSSAPSAPEQEEEEQQNEPEAAEPLHPRVLCDVCDASDEAKEASLAAGTRDADSGYIRGVRYKSAVKHDFDVCETCEAAGRAAELDVEPFLKITHPGLAPAHIVCVMPGAAEALLQEGGDDSHVEWATPIMRKFREFLRAGAGAPVAVPTPSAPPAVVEPPLVMGTPVVLTPEPATATTTATATYPVVAPLSSSRPAPPPPPPPPAAPAPAPTPTPAPTQRTAPPPPSVPSGAPIPMCPGGHVMTRFHTTHSNFVCNGCNQRCRAWSLMHGCRMCDYDLCQACVASSGAGAGARVAAAPATTAPTPAPQAKFVCDLTVYDGAQVEPGQRVVKKWRIKNSSATEPWPASTRLVHVGGDLLSGPAEGVPVPPVRPGELVDVAVPFVMPNEPGRYTSYWRLATGAPDNARFGHRLWLTVNVLRGVPGAPPPPPPVPVAAPSAPPAAGAVAPTTTATPTDFETAVAQIIELGFTDVDRVVTVLREVNGDMSRAVDRLLQDSA